MINFFSENEFQLSGEDNIRNWISGVISSEEYEEGDIDYVFCDDKFLLDLNKQFLNHDTFTDIISFDYTLGRQLNGEIYISTERVKDNAKEFGVLFMEELHRVMVHGVLHLCGYKDKSEEQKRAMRALEDKHLLSLVSL